MTETREVIFEDYLKLKLGFIDALAKYIKPSEVKTLFEIGCCEGEDTVKLSREFKNAQIYSFEPLPQNVQRTRYHLEKYKTDRVTVYELALSDQRGTAKFYVSSGAPKDAPHDPEWNYGNKSSSLLKPNKKIGLYKWLKFKKKIKVKTERLDNFCTENNVTEIDFLHMDVQGAELLVLDGAGAMLSNIKAIWLEVEEVELYEDQPLRNQVEDFMKQAGFTCVLDTVDHVTGDQLYINNSMLKK